MGARVLIASATSGQIAGEMGQQELEQTKIKKGTSKRQKRKKEGTIAQDVVSCAFDSVLRDGKDSHALSRGEEPHDTRKYGRKIV